MTSNQIAYWRAMEDRRANLAQEKLKDDANRESARHNKRSESIDSRQVAVKEDLAGSEKFKNVTQGISNIGKTVESVVYKNPFVQRIGKTGK